MVQYNEVASFEAFRDSLSTIIIAKLTPAPSKRKKKSIKGRKNEIKPVARVAKANGESLNGDVAGELTEFVEYLAEDIFVSLPPSLRTLSYAAVQEDPNLKEKYDTPLATEVFEAVVERLPPTVTDSLKTYGLIKPDASDLDRLIQPVLESYMTATTSPPPEYTPELTASRPVACEICEREHVPSTYHHLIPHQMHEKAIKRGWHKEWELKKVAWLCRACHSYVHKIATNEELARELYSVESLLQREDVQKWASWVGRIRWKAR